MTGLEFAFFVMDYVVPIGIIFLIILTIYIFVTDALTAHRRSKREREQQVH